MNILTIIDSFKGTITSKELGEMTKQGLEKKGHKVDYVTTSDGGEGFLEAFYDILNGKGKYHYLNCFDPLGRKIETCFLENEDTAYLEMAKSSGICLLKKEELNPFIATTYGFGQVIDYCIHQGFKKIVIGIGGSATNDCGVGMLEALGVKFYNRNNQMMKDLQNKDFNKIGYVDDSELKKKIKNISIVVLSDVANPLLGPNGATYVFSKQKGALDVDLSTLEHNIKCFSKFKPEIENYLGSGAAGGVGYALRAYLNAEFHKGLDYILDLINYEKMIEQYDVVITGEGKVDKQSLLGKVVFTISQRSYGKKVIVLCAINELEDVNLEEYNVYKVFSVVGDNITKEMSLNKPHECYLQMVEKIKL